MATFNPGAARNGETIHILYRSLDKHNISRLVMQHRQMVKRLEACGAGSGTFADLVRGPDSNPRRPTPRDSSPAREASHTRILSVARVAKRRQHATWHATRPFDLALVSPHLLSFKGIWTDKPYPRKGRKRLLFPIDYSWDILAGLWVFGGLWETDMCGRRDVDGGSLLRLARDKITAELGNVRGWTLRGRRISRRFMFNDFLEAMRFVNRVARLAEGLNHHPDISIHYDRVRLSLATHDEAGLTGKDFRLARKIDRLLDS